MPIRWPRKLSRRMVTVIASSAIVLIALPGTANAAAWHAISGSTYSSADVWYVSTNYRTKAGYGQISLWFSQLPTKRDGSTDTIKWRFIDNNGSIINGTTFYFSDWDPHPTLYRNDGTQFRNSYARYSHCTSGCNHDFSGLEEY